MAQRTSMTRVWAILVTMGLVVAACSDGDGSATTSTPGEGTQATSTTGPGQPAAAGVAPRTFGLQLSEGEALVTPPTPTHSEN